MNHCWLNLLFLLAGACHQPGDRDPTTEVAGADLPAVELGCEEDSVRPATGAPAEGLWVYEDPVTRHRVEAQANDSLLDLPHRSERLWTAGVIALADGHAADAEVALRETADEHVCAICALPDLARAYEARGNAAMAISAYERYITTPWYWRYEVDASELGFALKRLGELYEVRGDEERARQVRTRLLALWRRADAELQPTLADIRTRVALPRR